MSFLTPHIRFAELVDFVEGRTAATNRHATALAHVKACAQCAAKVADIERAILIMRADESADPPAHIIASAVSLFRARRALDNTADSVADALTAGARRLLAVLTFDSREMAPAHGMRAGQPSAERQLLFSAGDNDLDLRIAPSGEDWIVSGQVLGDCASGSVELFGPTDRVQATLNNLCEFTLPPVAAGNYTLRLRLGDTEVEASWLEVGR